MSRTENDVRRDPRPGDELAGPKLKLRVRSVMIDESRTAVQIYASLGLRSGELWFGARRNFTPSQWTAFVADAEVLHVAD